MDTDTALANIAELRADAEVKRTIARNARSRGCHLASRESFAEARELDGMADAAEAALKGSK